jgi:thioredoxin 1
VVSKVSEQEADVDFYYVDVDQSAEIASQYAVKSIPTLVLIKSGEETNRSVGFIPEEKVKAFANS